MTSGIGQTIRRYYVRTGQAPRLATSCDVKPSYDASGMITSTSVTMGTLKFRYDPVARIYDANPAKHWVVGRVVNLGRHDQPVSSAAWYEWLARPAS